MMCRGKWNLLLSLQLLMGSLLVVTAQGVIVCECTTQECRDDGTSSCYADHFCYSEYFGDTLTLGCMNDRSSLMCENHKPKGKGIDYWPSLYCCNDRNFCNKDVTPTLPPPDQDGGPLHPKVHTAHEGGALSSSSATGRGGAEGGDGGTGGGGGTGRPRQHNRHQDPYNDPPPLPPCSNDHGNNINNNPEGGNPSQQRRNSSGSSKVINPIYIAVPVAGVCVLLALVIFGMYLLRRRNHHHYDSYHHYHDHLAGVGPPGHHHKMPSGGGAGMGLVGGGGSGGPGGGMGGCDGGGGGGGGGSGVPLYHHHHHCDCICSKALPPCGGKVNRCTDSERSSSGSETKLFLQA